MDTDQDFEDFLREAESYALTPDTVVRSLSGEIIDPNDDACECCSTVRPQPMGVEAMIETITGVRRSPKVDRCKRFAIEYLAPRQDSGKTYHCLAYSYLMKRFGWTRNEVYHTLELLRRHAVIEIVYPAMSDLKRAPIYKVNDRFVTQELRCRKCGRFFPEVLQTARERRNA